MHLSRTHLLEKLQPKRPSARRTQQNSIPVKIQELSLALAKAAHVDDALGFDAHFGQRWLMRYRRDDQRARILEADEASIKQMIDARRQQQAVLAV